MSRRERDASNRWDEAYAAMRPFLLPPAAAQRDELASRLGAETSAPVGVVEAWQEGYRQGVLDERASEANIGIAGFGAKVEPARNNPYLAHRPTPVAPVGVEGPLSVFSAGEWRYSETGQTFSAKDLDEAAFVVYRDHLAQQPAAVDEAMVERAALAYEAEVDGDTHSPNAPREAMRAALTAALAQQPAAVDGNWQQKAAEWLEAKAVEQEANNQRWPDHAAAYKEWRDRPGVLRYLAVQVLAAQPGGSDNDR